MNARDVVLSPEAATALDRLLAQGALADTRLASLAARWRVLAQERRMAANDVRSADKGVSARLNGQADMLVSCANDAEQQLPAAPAFCPPQWLHSPRSPGCTTTQCDWNDAEGWCCRLTIGHDGQHSRSNVPELVLAPQPDGLHRALDLARGCSDYGGGYYDTEYEAFQHGIATVVKVLERAVAGDNDMQLQTVEAVGRKLRSDPLPAPPPDEVLRKLRAWFPGVMAQLPRGPIVFEPEDDQDEGFDGEEAAAALRAIAARDQLLADVLALIVVRT